MLNLNTIEKEVYDQELEKKKKKTNHLFITAIAAIWSFFSIGPPLPSRDYGENETVKPKRRRRKNPKSVREQSGVSSSVPASPKVQCVSGRANYRWFEIELKGEIELFSCAMPLVSCFFTMHLKLRRSLFPERARLSGACREVEKWQPLTVFNRNLSMV